MKAKKIVPILMLAATLAVAVILIRSGRQLQPSQPQAAPLAVRVMEVTPGPVQLQVYAQGTVEPRTETELVPEVSGNVVWMSPNLVSGGYFEAEETLLRIDDRDYRAEVQRGQASLNRARAELDHAHFELERAEDLHSRNLISRADLEGKIRSERVATSAVQDAQLVLQTARRDLERTHLRAPFAGLVRDEQVDVGQFISRGTPVASVYASDYLEVRLPIADQQLAYLNIPLSQRGEIDEAMAPEVELSAEFAGAKQVWIGKLARTEAEIDPGSRMVYAIARVGAMQADGGEGAALPPPVGLFVQAKIEGIAEEDIVVLPRSALRNQNQVLIVDADDRMHFRTVEVLRIYREEAYLSGGLQAGESVIVSPLQTVVEGMRVRPVGPES